MSRGHDAVVAVKEERARIGGVEVTKKTVIAATEEGVIAYEVNTVQATGSNNNPGIGYSQGAGYLAYPQQTALPAPSRVVIADPPERDCKYHCFACDEPYKWYEFNGKGICWVLLLLLFYLIAVAILLPIVVLICLCKCLSYFSDDN